MESVMLARVAASVRLGRSVTFQARGKSMTPKIRNNEVVKVRPLTDDEQLKKGQIVLARVQGRWYLHLVSALQADRVQISNNHGHVNGWTSRENVIATLDKEAK